MLAVYLLVELLKILLAVMAIGGYTYYVGEPGTPGAFAERLITDNNQQLHYFCINHSGMGGEITKNENITNNHTAS